MKVALKGLPFRDFQAPSRKIAFGNHPLVQPSPTPSYATGPATQGPASGTPPTLLQPPPVPPTLGPVQSGRRGKPWPPGRQPKA
jgi:hypothetical protein